MPHVAAEQVVVVGRAPRRLEDRERVPAQMPAPGRAPGRPEDGREARGQPGRDEHLPDLPLRRLGREPRKPDRQLPVTLPDRLRVVRGEQAAHIAVQPLDRVEAAVERHGERRLAVGHAVGFEFDERGAQPVRLGRGGRIDHRGRRAVGLLHVRHHRVAAREVVPLRAPDPAPRRLDGPRPPFERYRERRVQAVQVAKQVRVRLAGRRQQRIHDHRLAVERQVRALGLELREREPPVHAAARRAVPRHSRAVDQLRQEPGAFGGPQHLDGRVLTDERAARLDGRAEPAHRRLDLRCEVGRRSLPPALPQSGQPGHRSPPRALGSRTQARVVRPDRVGFEPLDAPGQERTALAGRDSRDAGRGLFLRTGHRSGPPKQVELEARTGTEPRQQPLPEPQHAVYLLRSAPVRRGGPHPARRDQLARTGQAGPAVAEPAPVGQLLGQRARCLMSPEFFRDPHRESVRMRRCQGSGAHLPGSNRAGYRAAVRSTANMAGSLRPASHPAP